MFTVVGLGNPGDEYRDTRHNVGFAVLGAFVAENRLPSFVQSSRYAGLISEGVFNGADVGILLPTGFMNNSGVSVAKYIKEHESSEQLIVVHDDVDLPFGEVRVSFDRGAGGHNGVQSIINTCITKRFVRVRVGVARKNIFGIIGRPRGDALSSFVLGKFTKSESAHLPEISTKVTTALTLIVTKGVEHAMQECNADTEK
jgi:peptidyl-tRNA hydrolase, PTH1 family